MNWLDRLYESSLLFLDALYKTTKYAVLLFFVVVKTNVNFQVVCVIVFDKETEPMATKALLILKSWSSLVNPKCAMVDFDQKQISALENVFPAILVILCDFHRKESWTRWTSKANHSVSINVDEVKGKLRRIAHTFIKE